MATKQLEVTEGCIQTVSFLSLPPEVQVQIYKHYYPPWSLVIRDGMFSISEGASLFKLPPPLNQESRPLCPSKHRRCQRGQCPQADYATLFNHEGRSTYVPSINLLLVCHFTYKLAFPIFESSYDKTVDVDVASYCLGNVICWRLFKRRFQKLLASTVTLHMNVSSPKEFGCGEEMGQPGNFNVAEYIPNLKTVSLADTFKLTNAQSLLNEFSVWNWTADTPKEQLEQLLERAARKRIELTLILMRAGCVFQGFKGDDLERGWRYIYGFRCRIEGMDGVYQASISLMQNELSSVRKLDDEEVDESYWANEVEEADFLGRDPCLVM